HHDRFNVNDILVIKQPASVASVYENWANCSTCRHERNRVSCRIALGATLLGPMKMADLHDATASTTGTVEPLFTPFRIRNLELPNRIVMAPMTRNRSPGGIPTADVARYYARRARQVAMTITEGT